MATRTEVQTIASTITAHAATAHAAIVIAVVPVDSLAVAASLILC